MGWVSYLQNKKFLNEKINHELHNTGTQVAGELDLWLKERFDDIRVFSSSYIVTENYSKTQGKNRTDIEKLVAVSRIKEYLKSVREKFADYEELILFNMNGEVVVTSSLSKSTVGLPINWNRFIQNGKPIIGKTYYDPTANGIVMIIAEAVRAADTRLLGILAAKINLKSIGALLKKRTKGGTDEIYLIDRNGRLLVGSEPIAGSLLQAEGNSDLYSSGSLRLKAPAEYIGFRGIDVIGISAKIPKMKWLVIAEMVKDRAYEEIAELQQITVLAVGGLLMCIGLIAYLFGHTMVSPLKRLSAGAGRVASGNLDVDLPIRGLSEVSYLTQVFNHMVASLRANREELSTANQALRVKNKELQKISITDGLTGLYNRKHIMELFSREIVRAIRYKHPLAVLIVDIDHFKKINDTYGHLTGDAVIRQLAGTFTRSVRDCDYVGRYGGEEFLIILPDSGVQSGLGAAERIRQNVSELRISREDKALSVTVSVGVAGYPDYGEDMESIINKADAALYRAKEKGRNRVITSGETIR